MLAGASYCGGYQLAQICRSGEISGVCGPCECVRSNLPDYEVTDVSFELDQFQLAQQKPLAIGSKDIRNQSPDSQSIRVAVTKAIRRTSSFEHSKGLELTTGMSFSSSLPFLDSSSSVGVTGKSSHTWGKTESVTTTFSNGFTCSGAPKTHSRCQVLLQQPLLSVPYTITLRSKGILQELWNLEQQQHY